MLQGTRDIGQIGRTLLRDLELIPQISRTRFHSRIHIQNERPLVALAAGSQAHGIYWGGDITGSFDFDDEPTRDDNYAALEYSFDDFVDAPAAELFDPQAAAFFAAGDALADVPLDDFADLAA